MHICMECRNHRMASNPNKAAPEVWYNHVCGAVRRKESIDPVTGTHGFSETNSLGMSYVTEEGHPYCRDINKDGNCQYFESKSTIAMPNFMKIFK